MGSTYKLALSYANLSKTVQHSWFKNLLSFVDLKPGSICVDIGCGTGTNTAHLADKVGRQGFVTGIDPDENRIKIAKEEYMRENINYIIGKSTCIPAYTGGYDLIVCSGVGPWIEYNEKIQTYEKAHQFLKEGGILAICEGAGFMKNATPFLQVLSPEQREAFILHFMTIEENEKILKAVGFEITKMENIEDKHTFPSLDDFLNWSTATVNDKRVDFHNLYKDNKDIIDIPMGCGGTVDTTFSLNYMIMKKE